MASDVWHAKLTLCNIREGLKQKNFSATELTQACLDAISRSTLNAFLCVDRRYALDAATESERRFEQGAARAFEGVPIAIKDNIAVNGMPMTAGSKILESFMPPYDATVIKLLRDAGAVILGKTNLDEFAMGSSNMTSFFGPVENPWRSMRQPETRFVPGGSSGGSAAAVSGALAPLALGTDTGGSVRQPASFCGLVGVKPTYGRVSRFGVVALASSFDQVGPFAKTVQDAADLLFQIAGHDARESTSSHKSMPDLKRVLQNMPEKALSGMKVGVPREYESPLMGEDVQRTWENGKAWLEKAGASVVPVSMPHTKYALQTYTVIMFAEASSNLARYDGVRYGLRAPSDTLQDVYQKTRDQGFGDEVKRRILLGSYILSQSSYETYFCQAQKVRRLIKQDFDEVFEKVDCLLTPTAPTAAFPMDQVPDDPTTMYLNDIFTTPVNLAGVPAMSVPAGLNEDGLPLGLQVIARPFEEELMFKVALCLEKAANFPLEGALSTKGHVA